MNADAAGCLVSRYIDFGEDIATGGSHGVKLRAGRVLSDADVVVRGKGIAVRADHRAVLQGERHVGGPPSGVPERDLLGGVIQSGEVHDGGGTGIVRSSCVGGAPAPTASPTPVPATPIPVPTVLPGRDRRHP